MTRVRPDPSQPRLAPRTGAAMAAVLALSLAGCGGRAPEPPAPPPVPPAKVGVSLASYHYDVEAVERWERAVGHRADVLQTFVGWEYDDADELAEFPTFRAQQLAAEGRTLEITWGPQNPSKEVDQPKFSLDSIVAGEHDDYVRSFAEAVKKSGLEIRLRFGHEMNGAWTSYSEENSGNDRGDFVRAWRHLHDVFADVGATDVVWVWSPNIVGPDQTPLPGLYPGDAFVDLVGIDGYSYPRSVCPSPSNLFDETLRGVRAISDRPVVLAEVGVERRCPDRAAWIRDLFDWAGEHGVREVTWWERGDDRDDYRILDDPAALRAFRAAVDR